MADPHIRSPMDFWDYLTVIIYRSGFVLASLSLFALPYYPTLSQKGLLCAVAMLASSLHIYLKHYRLLLQFAAWIALLLQINGLPLFALGAAFFTLGGLCFKEYFCFRITGLNFQPILLIVLWLTIALQPYIQAVIFLSEILSLVAALFVLILAIQKWRMPLHFDIGDKRNYQL